MLSRRVLLQSGAAMTVLAPHGLILAQTPAPGRPPFDRVAGTKVSALLVAHAPELTVEGPVGWWPGCLRRAGLVPLAVSTDAGLAWRGDDAAGVGERCRDGRPLGLVTWGAGTARAGLAALSGVATAVVLIDAPDALPPTSGARMLCHFATGRSAQERRAIELGLAAIERSGAPFTCHWYDAAPGFAAPGQALGATADLVWRRSAAFLARSLAQPEEDGLPCAADGAAWA